MELLFYDNYISGNWIDGDDVIRGEEKTWTSGSTKDSADSELDWVDKK